MNRRASFSAAATIAAMAFGLVLPVLAASEPVVGAVTPASAAVNAAVNVSASYSDTDGVASCALYVNGTSAGDMTLSGGANSKNGTATISHTFGTNGGANLQVRCRDINGNFGVSAMAMATVAPASPPAPVVGPIVSTGATVDAAASFTATYSDTDAVSTCTLVIDGDHDGSMTLAAGTATVSHTFIAAGQHQLQARCTDVAGNVGHGGITTVNVMPGTSASAPTVGAFAALSGTVGQPVSFSASYADTNGVSSCKLFVDGSENSASVNLSGGANSDAGNVSASHTFTSAGQHTGYFRCVDANGSAGIGASATFNVYAAAGGSGTGDTIAPSAPINLTVGAGGGNTPTFNWTASTDNTAVTAYETSVDGAAYVRGTNALNFTVGTALSNGAHTFSVRALDAAGNVSGISTINFNVNEGGSVPVSPVGGVFTLEMMNAEALFTFGAGTRAEFESAVGKPCEWAAADATVKVNAAIVGIAGSAQRTAIENFAACGTGASMKLGAGERLGVVNSFKSAFGRLPNSQEDWFDVIKIGNGRFPGHTNADAETRAKASFKKVYLRDADTSVTADNNAVVVMAYGLRPLPRNLNSEAASTVSFRAVYGRTPTSAADWDIVRAIAYSGATR